MKYVSTRGGVESVGFQSAVMMGLADDGGLIVPQSIPDVRDRLDDWREMDYTSLAMEIFSLFIDDIDPSDLSDLVERTYSPEHGQKIFRPQPAQIVQVGRLHVLELWHGPTLSFKDIALQFLGNLFEYILAKRRGVLNILCATSGDTGSAAIYGVRSRRGIQIFVMHPHNLVSPIQRKQMTSVADDNVYNIAIEGSFDDCQRIMKTIAGGLDFKRRYSLGAVNSVNWARVLAQIVYYFHAAFAVQRTTGAEAVRFCVPTGNFGDILAGWYAMQMGLPVERLILATNENDILSRFFNTGEYSLGEVAHTLSPAMDIQVASNFERYLYYKTGCDADKLRATMEQFAASGSLRIDSPPSGIVDSSFIAQSCDRAKCLETIRKYHTDYDYLLDPHTAVGVAAADAQDDGSPIICLSTAHPAKFPEAIEQATGENLARHADIDALANLPTRCEILPNDADTIRDFIIENSKK